MQVFRLCKHAHTSLTGKGNYKKGARWNPPGRPVGYTSQTSSLTVLEVLTHIQGSEIPDDYMVAFYAIPDTAEFEDVTSSELDFITKSNGFHTRGLAWINGTALCLRTPSIVNPLEVNVMINPAHADFPKVTLLQTVPFRFDLRLLPQLGA